MKIRFLKNVRNLAELKKEYVKQLKTLHPDNGGSKEDCQQLNAEYEYLRGTLPAGSEPETEAEKKAAASLDKEIREALEKIIHFENINIEIIGTWIWIDGVTYPIKEELKAAGYIWSKNRKKWHYTPYDSPKYYKGKKKDFNTIRKMYGSEEVESEPAAKLA